MQVGRGAGVGHAALGLMQQVWCCPDLLGTLGSTPKHSQQPAALRMPPPPAPPSPPHSPRPRRCPTFGFLCAAAFLCSCAATNCGPTASASAVRVSKLGPFSLRSATLSTRPPMATKASRLGSVAEALATTRTTSNCLAITCGRGAVRVVGTQQGYIRTRAFVPQPGHVPSHATLLHKLHKAL